MDTTDMETIAARVCKEYGFKMVGFELDDELFNKVRWTRFGNEIRWTIAGHTREMDELLFEETISKIMMSIVHQEHVKRSPQLKEWAVEQRKKKEAAEAKE